MGEIEFEEGIRVFYIPLTPVHKDKAAPKKVYIGLNDISVLWQYAKHTIIQLSTEFQIEVKETAEYIQTYLSLAVDHNIEIDAEEEEEETNEDDKSGVPGVPSTDTESNVGDNKGEECGLHGSK